MNRLVTILHKLTGIYLTSFLLLLPAALSAQQSVLSGNSKFVGTYDYLGKDKVSGTHAYSVKIYSVAYKTLIQDVNVRLASKADIDSISLSHNGKLLFVYQKPEHMLYNVRTGKLVAKFNYPVKIAAAHGDNFFVVSNYQWVKSFDSYTGEELDTYQTAADNKINHLEVTPDDGLIIAKTDREQVIFWKAGVAKARKKFFGDDVVLDKEGKTFTITRITGNALNTSTYSLPEFKRIKKQNIEKLLRDRARFETLEIRKSDPSKRSTIIRPSRYINSGHKLSNVGNYISFFAQSPNDEKELYVVNTLTGEIILEEVVGTMKQQVEVIWYNDSLMIPVNAIKSGVFNARRAVFDKELDLEFFADPGKIREKKQVESRRVSPDFNLSALENGNDLLVRDNTPSGYQFTFTDHEWLGFSPNSEYIFVRNRNSDRTGYVKSREIRQGEEAEVTYFSEQKKDYTEDQVKEEKLPENYSYKRLLGFKHISEARAEDSLQIILKTVESGKRSGVQVQLIDKNGIYYYGAGAEQWKRIWCNLMVKGSDGKVRQIDDFTVTENRVTDTLPNAISVVMDYSGSMGWPRADALQDGVEKFIKAKNPRDEVALIKYDSKVMLESKLDDNQQKLLRKLYKTDYSAFGGATALLDAMNAGIYAVHNADNSGKKIVIAMTDGFENASMATRNEVLANAVKNGVNIYTIGFGQLVDESYLKSLSYTTYGGHYQVFQTPDLDWVFTDIYQKAGNYYAVNYETEDRGSQVYLLKICKDGLVSDSLAVEYDNNPADIALLLSNDDVYKPNPVKADRAENIDLKGFDYPEIKDFSRVKMRRPKVSQQVKLDEDKITAIEDEFMTIELPRFNFYYDEVRTVQETERRLRELADFMRKYPEIRLEIIGHTDNSGTTEYNDRLSLERAVKVRDLIVDKGIEAERFEVRGYGETSPVADNNTEEGRSRNRRVEFRIINE